MLPGQRTASAVRTKPQTLSSRQGLEEIIVRGARHIYALLDRGKNQTSNPN